MRESLSFGLILTLALAGSASFAGEPPRPVSNSEVSARSVSVQGLVLVNAN